ncbi:unnamed protein product [Orchesella dallaii]|uniref:C2H2-type domain-containing protein n=1 Tax=Orchesella dallaii TaxID=48710 RepID=A0ABP1RMJ0_9HEXA
MDISSWRGVENPKLKSDEGCSSGRNGGGAQVTVSKAHCLFCAKEVPAVITVINGKVTKIKEEVGAASAGGLGEDGCIEGQLRCMFILLNILDVGVELCTKLLGKWGSRIEPQFWFNVCNSCKVDVYEIFETVLLINKFEKKAKGIKDKLKNRIVGSVNGLEGDAGPFGILMEIRQKVIEGLMDPEEEEPSSDLEISVDEEESETSLVPMVYPHNPQPGPSSTSAVNTRNKKFLYKCELCSALVSRKIEHIRNHQNLHLGVGNCRGETCNVCGWLVWSMCRHMRNWHSGTTPLDMANVIIRPLSQHSSLQQVDAYKEVKEEPQVALAKLYPTQTPSAYSHKCRDCGELLKTRKRLLSHMEEVHGKIKIEKEDEDNEPTPSTSSFRFSPPKKYDPMSVLKLEFSSPAKSSVGSSSSRFDREESHSPGRPLSNLGSSSSHRNRHKVLSKKKRKQASASSSKNEGYTVKQIGTTKYYACLLCPAKFHSSLIRLKLHLKLHNKDGGGIPCTLCGEFIHSNKIANHQKLYCRKRSHPNSNTSPPTTTTPVALPRSHSQRVTKPSTPKGTASSTSTRGTPGPGLYHKCGECGALICSRYGKLAISTHQSFHNDPDFASKVYNCDECGWLVSKSRVGMHNRRWHPPSGNPLAKMKVTTKTFEVKYLNKSSPKRKLNFSPSASTSKSTPTSRGNVKVELNSSLTSAYKAGRNFLRKCGECGSLQSSKIRLELHKQLHRSGEGLNCSVCGWLVKPSNISLENHRRYYHANDEEEKIIHKPNSICIPENVPFYCDNCPMIYPDVTNFINHYTQTHKIEKGLIQCELCEMQVESKQMLKMHLMTNHDDQVEEGEEDEEEGDQVDGVLQCQNCPEIFETKMQLDFHLASIHPTTLLRCSPCGIGFSSFYFYKRHNLTFHVNGAATSNIEEEANASTSSPHRHVDVDQSQGRKRARESRELRATKKPREELNGKEQKEQVYDSPGKRRSTRVNGMDKGSIED